MVFGEQLLWLVFRRVTFFEEGEKQTGKTFRKLVFEGRKWHGE
jgi:hypothetical protein